MKRTPSTFKRCSRLNRKCDFRRVYNQGLTYRGRFLTLFSCRNKLPHHRIAIIVSRRLEPLSTRRNYFRRIIREVYRKNTHHLKEHCDAIFRLHRQPNRLYHLSLKQDFLNFCKKQTRDAKTHADSNN